MNRLLIVACSGRKFKKKTLTSAFELYDGVNYRVIKKTFREQRRPDNLTIKILSAKYGLIDETFPITNYDVRFNKTTAKERNTETINRLKSLDPIPDEIFVNLGKTYLLATSGINDIFTDTNITYAKGGIGTKMKEMKNWLVSLYWNMNQRLNRFKHSFTKNMRISIIWKLSCK